VSLDGEEDIVNQIQEKMVKLWAEKEYRNLLRIKQAKIPCPKPISLKLHVLVMSFIGVDGWPYPRLKDAVLDLDEYNKSYRQIIQIMRRMFTRCKLVHADLSEYNILYNTQKKRCYIIDVSQSVEHDHPNSLDFLRKDCTNIIDFFSKHGVQTITPRQLFDFITDTSIQEDQIKDYLETIHEMNENTKRDENDEINDEAFMGSYIPRNLEEFSVYGAEEEYERITGGEEMIYSNITGLEPDFKVREKPIILQEKKKIL